MRLVFLGTPENAVPSLRALVRDGHDVALVVTRPDRPAGRELRPQAPAVKRAALEESLPVLQPATMQAELLERVRAVGPELLVVVAFGRILSPSVLAVAPGGAINVHFSLLPKYRGAAPVQWALARGETVTGVTTMQMNERMDEGDVLLQRSLSIAPREHAPALAGRLAALGAELLTETLRRVARRELQPEVQDHAQASLAPRLRRQDGEIDPSLPAVEIEGRIRGFDPWPGIWVRLRERRVRLVDGRVVTGPPGPLPPGTVWGLTAEEALVACAPGTGLALASIQLEGRKVLPVRDAIHGRLLAVGDRLAPLASPD